MFGSKSKSMSMRDKAMIGRLFNMQVRFFMAILHLLSKDNTSLLMAEKLHNDNENLMKDVEHWIDT